MNNEGDFKNAFCESVKKQGGYTFKIAMSTVSGLPDLYCILPGYAPTLLEAKYIKDCGPTFKRKIPYRPLQRNILNESNKALADCSEGLIAYGLICIDYYDKSKVCVLMPPQVEVITHKDLFKRPGSQPIIDNVINVRYLFDAMVPPLSTQPVITETLLETSI